MRNCGRCGISIGIFVAGVAGLLPGASAVAQQLGAVTDHVVIISVDGLRADAIARYQLKTMGRLVREGANGTDAQTITPAKTLPSHTSMLTGVSPAIHGITWNSDMTDSHGVVAEATIFEIAKQHGFSTAAFFSKSKFHHLQKPGTLDYTQAPSGIEHWMATKTVPDVKQYLRSHRPNLLFVHIGEPDYAGHATGWGSAPYGWAVRRADAGVSQVINAATNAFGAGNFTLILTADHGGHARGHGAAEDVTDMKIPLILWGQGVKTGEIATGLRTMDTAATALWLLGVQVPTGMEGKPILSGFSDAARTAGNIAQRAVAGVSR